MWRLDFREWNITKWHHRFYFFNSSVIKKSWFERITLWWYYNNIIRKKQVIDDYIIWSVDYQECNITPKHVKYFANKSKAQAFIRWLKQNNWDYFALTEERISNL